MLTKDQHLDNVWTTIMRPLLNEAAEVIEALKPGEKIPATELAKLIAERHGMTGPQLYPTLKFIIDDYPGVLVKRGAHGGIIKLDPSKPEDPQGGTGDGT